MGLNFLGILKSKSTRQENIIEQRGEEVFSFGPSEWLSNGDGTTDITREAWSIHVNVTSTKLYCPITLPDGAIVTKVKVVGNAAAESADWQFCKNIKPINPSQIFTAKVNSEVIGEHIVNNQDYYYFIYFDTSELEAGDEIYYAEIVVSSTRQIGGTTTLSGGISRS